jgi:hypothetical protein
MTPKSLDPARQDASPYYMAGWADGLLDAQLGAGLRRGMDPAREGSWMYKAGYAAGGQAPMVVPGKTMSAEHELAAARVELDKIDDILRSYGFEYPLGSRGVADLALHYAWHLDELHALDPDHWRSVVRPPNHGPITNR